MTLYLSEHTGNYPNLQPLTQAPLTSYTTSSTSAPVQTSTSTRYVRVSADAGSLFSPSVASSTTALTSTNAVRVPANVQPELFAVSPGSKIWGAST